MRLFKVTSVFLFIITIIFYSSYSFAKVKKEVQCHLAAQTVEVGEAPVLEDPSEPIARGIASWYGKGFHGRKTANGERYNMHDLTCASKKLPFGTMVEVTNLDNGEKVVVRVNDRGPYVRKRIIDLSFAAAKQIGLIKKGSAQVEIREASADPRPKIYDDL